MVNTESDNDELAIGFRQMFYEPTLGEFCVGDHREGPLWVFSPGDGDAEELRIRCLYPDKEFEALVEFEEVSRDE